MSHSVRPGELLAGRYRLIDLLTESGGGRFWRAHDRVLERQVAIHVIDAEDERAPGLLEAARRSAMVLDRRILRVLDAESRDGLCYVVNEWGEGVSLDILVAGTGPLGPRRSAWLVAEAADSIAQAHEAGVAHGRLVPENILIDRAGEVRVIGFCVEAALHGLPPDRMPIDVIDLAGLLYCALTTKWAGASGSAVPPAPTEHGRVLRPRRVRAGVPGPLDALCDDVLHLHGSAPSHSNVDSARDIATYLQDFIGDPTGLQAAVLASIPKLRPDQQVVLPQVPEIPVRDTSDLILAVPDEPEPEPEREPEPEPEPVAEEPNVAPEDLPTEAGMPIFDDDDDEVEWFRARSTPAPPPPPFEEPPERPLFAPDPEDGGPVRRSRVPAASAAPGTPAYGPEYWPWENDPALAGGPLPVVPEEEVPGRNWFRLAVGIAAGVVVLLAVVVAFNLGRGKTVLGQEPDDDEPAPTQRSERTIGPVEPLSGLVATDFDPQAQPPEENPEDAPLAVDGDPATAWTTSSYRQQLGPGGLKTGVGLTIDLGDTHTVTQIDLTLIGAPTDVSFYLTDTAPTRVADLTPVASETAGGDQLSVTLDEPTDGRYLVVWLTSLPNDGGGFRGQVAEVVVRGA